MFSNLRSCHHFCNSSYFFYDVSLPGRTWRPQLFEPYGFQVSEGNVFSCSPFLQMALVSKNALNENDVKLLWTTIQLRPIVLFCVCFKCYLYVAVTMLYSFSNDFIWYVLLQMLCKCCWFWQYAIINNETNIFVCDSSIL